MTDFWLKLKVWAKVGLFTVLALFCLIFVFKNDSASVDIWFVKSYHTTVLRLLFFTFLFGIGVTLLVRTTFRTLRQVSDLKERNRAQRMERDLAGDGATRPPGVPPIRKSKTAVPSSPPSRGRCITLSRE